MAATEIREKVNSITDLKALINIPIGLVVETDSYYGDNNGGGNVFTKVTDTGQSDNGGTIILGTDLSVYEAVEAPYVDVKQFGAIEGTDFRDVAQDTLDWASGKTEVLVDGLYTLDVSQSPPHGLLIPSDTVLRLTDNSIITSTTAITYTFIKLDGVSNVKIIGGKYVGDRDIHVNPLDPAIGHGVYLTGECNNIEIIDVETTKFWGDGLLVSGASGVDEPCTDINISNCLSHNNKRQGLSITSAKGVSVIDSKFYNQNDGSLMAGLDIEPNPGNHVEDVFIERCEMTDNEGSGLIISSFAADGVTRNININECVMDNNLLTGITAGGTGSHSDIHINNVQIIQPVLSTRAAIEVSIIDNITIENAIIDADGSYAYIMTYFGNNIVLRNIEATRVGVSNKTGISCLQNISNVLVENCTVDTNKDAITFAATEKTRSNVTLRDNTVTSTIGRAINVNWVDGLIIENNKVLGSGYDGINVANCNNFSIIDNFVTDAAKVTTNVYNGIYVSILSTIGSILRNSIKVGSGGNTILRALRVGVGCDFITIDDNDFSDTYGAFAINNEMTGAYTLKDFLYPVYGTTANRSSELRTGYDIGFEYFDTDLGHVIYWNGTVWVNSIVAILDTGTEIDLSNIAGTPYNTALAISDVVYTTVNEVDSGNAYSLINTASEPTVTGGTKISGATWVISTDMYLVIQYNGTRVEFYFLEI